jgi:S-adenosylmethionine-diacylglycerol 3-amino-3-carboxypropyl transferase
MTQSYFQSLNYSMANEDTTLEYKLAQRINAKSILTIGGSGSRCLPFMALPISHLKIVDVSADQILFIRFKLETIRQLSHLDCVEFWISPDGKNRDALFESLKLNQEFKDFYKFQRNHHRDQPPLFWGKWEKTFQTFSKITSLLFSRKVREGLFETSEPYAYFEKHIKGWRWDLLLKIVGNKAMFNSLLYKGDFIKKNSPLTYFEYYSQAFDRLFRLDIKRSHFLQLCFLGKVYPLALPIEFSPEIFAKIKASVVEPTYQQGSVFERKGDSLYDLISLSDVPSYLSGGIEREYVQVMKNHLNEKGIIVNRFYLRTTENTDESGFQNVSHDHRDLIGQELVQMYQVQLLQKL